MTWLWLGYMAIGLVCTGYWARSNGSHDWAWLLLGLMWPGVLLLELGDWIARRVRKT